MNYDKLIREITELESAIEGDKGELREEVAMRVRAVLNFEDRIKKMKEMLKTSILKKMPESVKTARSKKYKVSITKTKNSLVFRRIKGYE